MEAYLLDWVNLLLRWVHVITAIAWIGSSFYFVFLDNNLQKPNSPDLLEKGVDGAMWAIHGGGFYNPQKYMVAPKKIHTKLHWFFLGKLFHLDQWLCPVHGDVFVECQHLSH